jgi:hypothetical protein
VVEIISLLGLAALTAAIGVLMWTRWGQSQALSKCVALSVIAHMLLLLYAYGTHVLFSDPASTYGTRRFGNVRLVDDIGDEPHEPLQVAEAPPEQPVPDEPPVPQPEPPTLTDPPPQSVTTPPTVEPQPEPEPPAPQPTAIASSNDPPPSEVLPSPMPPMMVATPARPVKAADGLPVPATYAARMSSERRSLLDKFGGNPDTERAVQNALAWLAEHQEKNGRWDPQRHGGGRETRTFGHDRGGAGAKAETGITGLAVLAFLGNGETHLEGEHRAQVQHGLEFILGAQAADGSLAGDAEFFAAMYCHGISLLAVSEAYVLTGDRRLEPGLKRAVQYSINSQHSTGGWRYRPGDTGDMSQFGWQVMALRSAHIAGIPVPDETWRRMKLFLHNCSSGTHGGRGAYRPGDRPSRSMTAEAMACRFFLDSSNSPEALAEGAEHVREELPGRSANFYYWYYGTVAMFQRGGDDWNVWNKALQAALLDRQRADGDYAGSWDPDPLWGGYGGRVFSTAMGALCLEAYYRYLPVILDDAERELRLTNRPTSVPR